MDSGSDIYFKWANELKSLSLTPKISSTLSGDIFLAQDTIRMHHHSQQALTWKASWVTPIHDVTFLCSYSSSYFFVCGTDSLEHFMGLFHAYALGSERRSTYSYPVLSTVSSPWHVPHTCFWKNTTGGQGAQRWRQALCGVSSSHTAASQKTDTQSIYCSWIFFFLSLRKSCRIVNYVE